MDREASEQGSADRRLRRRRLRRAGERLTEDSSLRDALTDEQASQLLDWGMAQIKTDVELTRDLPDEPADAQLEKTVTQVRHVMHQVNQVIDSWTGQDPAGRWQMLLELGQFLRPLQSNPAGFSASTQTLFALGQSDTDLDQDALFERLMAVLRGGTTPPDSDEG